MPNVSLRPRKESEILRAILDYLAVCPGVVAFRANVGAVQAEYRGKRRFVRFGVKGMPDVIGSVAWCYPQDRSVTLCRGHPEIEPLLHRLWVHRPRPFGFEVKRPGEPLSPEQSTFGALLARAGWIFRRVECVADVQRALGR